MSVARTGRGRRSWVTIAGAVLGLAVVPGSTQAEGTARGVINAQEPVGLADALEPRRVALVIGVDEYVDPELGDLRFASRDAYDLATMLGDPALGGFDLVSQVTGSLSQESFWHAFRAATGHLQRDDTFLLYLAGHGTMDLTADGAELYYMPTDGKLQDPRRTGIPLVEIQDAFERLPARRRVMVLDTCYSGSGRSAVPKETLERIRGMRGPLPAAVARQVSESEVRLYAAHHNQPALEDSKLENGVYTYYFVEGLRGEADVDGDGLVEVMEAHQWARDRTLEYSGGVQVPWVETTVVGRQSVFLAGPAEARKEAEAAIYAELEAADDREPAESAGTQRGIVDSAGEPSGVDVTSDDVVKEQAIVDEGGKHRGPSFLEVPAGSTLHVLVPGGATVADMAVPWDQGVVAEDVGLPIAPYVELGSVEAGEYHFQIEHQLLGPMAGDLTVVEGQPTDRVIDWRSAPRYDELRSAYALHLEREASFTAVRDARRRGTLELTAGAGLLAGAAGAVVFAVKKGQAQDQAWSDYQEALAAEDYAAANSLFDERNRARRASQFGWIGAGLGAAAGGVSLTLSFGSYDKARRSQIEAPTWNPSELDL